MCEILLRLKLRFIFQIHQEDGDCSLVSWDLERDDLVEAGVVEEMEAGVVEEMEAGVVEEDADIDV